MIPAADERSAGADDARGRDDGLDGRGAAPEEVLALLRLMAVPGLGPSTLWKLLRRYGDAESALGAVLRGATGLARAPREHLDAPAEVQAARSRLAQLAKLGAGVLVRGRAAYPEALLSLASPPTLVFFRGRLELLQRNAVSIIGARRCTPYGLEATRLLAAGIARADVVVVSGLALGIDGAAHRAALEVGGATVAVVGTGVDVAYPRRHAALQSRIAEDGLLISELLPGTGPRKHHFPERNRLIMALSKGMIVVEAGPKSGTRKTVEMALDHGVTVFAVPGPIGRPQSEGPHALLRDGAALASSPEAVLEELNLPVPPTSSVTAAADPEEPVAAGTGSKRLLDALGGWEGTVDELASAAGLHIAEVLPMLLELELRGAVERRPGARFAAVVVPATRVTATG